MTMAQRSTVVGLFHERDDAREAIEALKDAGFDSNDISILSPDKQVTADMAAETGTHAGSGAATGAVAGGLLGGLGGWLVGIGALAIPGIGPFIAAGAFATALGGAAIGAGVGAIAGALAGMGVPEEEASYYEGEVKSGRTLVTVRADGRFDEAQRILRQHGAYDIESGAGAAGPGSDVGAAQTRETGAVGLGSQARTAEADETLELRAEELAARKTTVETGEVSIGKDVVEERRTLEVPVTREEVTIERHRVDRPSDRPIEAGSEQTIEVPIRAEQVELEKRAVVYEEVEVGKRRVQETEQVSGTVRHEEARIEREGDVQLGDSAARPAAGWDQAVAGYRTRWQQRAGATGGRWEDEEPGYRYGWELRNNPRYHGRQWTEIESDVQQDWTRRHPETPWARARESIRETWEDVTS